MPSTENTEQLIVDVTTSLYGAGDSPMDRYDDIGPSQRAIVDKLVEWLQHRGWVHETETWNAVNDVRREKVLEVWKLFAAGYEKVLQDHKLAVGVLDSVLADGLISQGKASQLYQEGVEDDYLSPVDAQNLDLWRALHRIRGMLAQGIDSPPEP